MSETSTKVLVLNRRQQPLELHCGREVVVVPPNGAVEVPASELDAPQIRVLRARRYVVVRAASQEGPRDLVPEAPPSPPAGARRARVKAPRKK